MPASTGSPLPSLGRPLGGLLSRLLGRGGEGGGQRPRLRALARTAAPAKGQVLLLEAEGERFLLAVGPDGSAAWQRLRPRAGRNEDTEEEA
jgi:hypothetical protein